MQLFNWTGSSCATGELMTTVAASARARIFRTQAALRVERSEMKGSRKMNQ